MSQLQKTYIDRNNNGNSTVNCIVNLVFLYVTTKLQFLFLLLGAEHSFITKGTEFFQLHTEKRGQCAMVRFKAYKSNLVKQS